MILDKKEIEEREEWLREEYTTIDKNYSKPLIDIRYYDKILPLEILYSLLEIKELLEELKNKRNESN